MIVKTIARKITLNLSSNGQLMKTALAAAGVRLGRFATRCPQVVTDSSGEG
jgi:hypothetical protein